MAPLTIPVVVILASVASLAAAKSYSNTIYMIRHGEKPSNGSTGLSAQGEERAECLTNVFGPSSDYDIGYIMAETPSSDGSHDRPYETVLPLSEELGLAIDTSCAETKQNCVANAVEAYAETSDSQNILICWEHGQLNNIASALGVKKPPSYPDDAYNLIWTVQDQTLVSITSEDCPGLDTD